MMGLYYGNTRPRFNVFILFLYIECQMMKQGGFNVSLILGFNTQGQEHQLLIETLDMRMLSR